MVVPAFIPFCNETTESDFFDTVAHEFGHAVLVASVDIMHSLTHKGTSTVAQNPSSSAPTAVCDGSDMMDIMNYFQVIQMKWIPFIKRNNDTCSTSIYRDIHKNAEEATDIWMKSFMAIYF